MPLPLVGLPDWAIVFQRLSVLISSIYLAKLSTGEPQLVQEVFRTLTRLRDGGVTVPMAEQNAKCALADSDHGVVLDLGQVRLQGKASYLLNDPRVGQLFLGGTMEKA